ncbi:MAG: hypothetical protein Q8O93_02860 [bacterium]|nr:hypothetical protein [bacterium]
MKKKITAAIIAAMLFMVVSGVVITIDLALTWWQWTGLFVVGLAIWFFWLHLTAEV